MNPILWQEIIFWADRIIFLLFLLSVTYVFILSLASVKKIKNIYPETKKYYRFVIFITGEEDTDELITASTESFLSQNFPKDKYDVVITTYGLKKETINSLCEKNIICIENETNATSRIEAVNNAIKHLDSAIYDVAVIMTPNNIVESDFLYQINKAYHSGGMAIQTHRVSETTKSYIGLLSSVAEEINNSIFRRGHVNLGFSSSLIGSGMAFNYNWLKQNINHFKSPSMTKQLENALLKQGIFIEYLENVVIHEEKINRVSKYSKQRKEWSDATRYSLNDALKDFPKSLFSGNFDYSNKIFQWTMPSKFLLMAYTLAIAVLLIFVEWTLSLKWWILFGLLLLSFSISIPEKYHHFKTFLAFLMLPIVVISLLFNKLKKR